MIYGLDASAHQDNWRGPIRFQNKTHGFFLFFGACNGLPVTFMILRNHFSSYQDSSAQDPSIWYGSGISWHHSWLNYLDSTSQCWQCFQRSVPWYRWLLRQCYNCSLSYSTCANLQDTTEIFRWTLCELLRNASMRGNPTLQWALSGKWTLCSCCCCCVRWQVFQERIVMQKEKRVQGTQTI